MATYLRHWLRISSAPSIGSLVSLYRREKTPWRGSQVKYRTDITEPSFFPIGSSRKTL